MIYIAIIKLVYLEFIDNEIELNTAFIKAKLIEYNTDNYMYYTGEQKEMMDLLTDVCGVKKLSECITKQIMSSSEDPCPSQQDYFHVIIPIIQQYLMARYKDVYRNCQLKNTKELFQDAEFYQV